MQRSPLQPIGEPHAVPRTGHDATGAAALVDDEAPILVATGLTKSFGGTIVVKGASLSVKRGSIHALIGPNGAGKSTMFGMLSGFLPPTKGRIEFEGTDITHERPEAVARRGLVRSFQISAVFGHLSVHENVRVALQRHAGMASQFWRSDAVLERLDARADELLKMVNLTDYRDVPAVNLSYGRKRSLEIVTTFAVSPKLLLLDEPMAGMGHEDIDQVVSLIRHIAAGRTILMVEHNLSVVRDLCDTITVLQRGEVIAEGDYATVSNDARVREAYIGTQEED
ncbi:MAG: Broad-specificity amino acid ABC transporter, ATP-binding protein 1 [uncultured Paraburkholderia sp.]|nr:MAG: Broad-specificity amino acid ABC transporter, ATP-binding protein 1 [uncultured Paraburkholderia sp.]CAH2942186.1 MAG: Broad-specificity amino acid ABC transporter, ATP-binding protein 1 [uncultured Paraburkholderia sp.]